MDKVWAAQQEEKEKGRWQRAEAGEGGDKPSLWWCSCTLGRKTNEKPRNKKLWKTKKKDGTEDGGLGGGKRQSSSLLPGAHAPSGEEPHGEEDFSKGNMRPSLSKK